MEGISLASSRSKGDAMNHEEVLAVLPDRREDAKSIKEIAQAMGLEVSSYVDWVWGQSGDWSGPWVLWSNGAGLPVMRGRKRKATGFGIMPAGRRSWLRSKYSNDIEPLQRLYPQSDLMCTRMLQILIRTQKELCKRIIERVLRGRPPTFATFYN